MLKDLELGEFVNIVQGDKEVRGDYYARCADLVNINLQK